MAILPTAADEAITKANITGLVLQFTKLAREGRPCTYLNEVTHERCSTHYTIDKDFRYFIILSPKSDEGALAVCSLAQISEISSAEQKTWERALEPMLTNMSVLEKELLSIVVHREIAKSGKLLRLCLLSETQAARDEFLLCMRVLSVYAKTLLQNKMNKKKPSTDLPSFLSCLVCRSGSTPANSFMHGTQMVDGIDTAFQIYLPQYFQCEVDEDAIIGEHQHRVDSDGRIHIIWLPGDREIHTARLPGGVLPGDVVCSKIGFERKNGKNVQRIQKGDEGRVVGASPDNQGVNINFATMDNVNLLTTEFTTKQNDDSQNFPPGEIEEFFPQYLDAGPRDAFNLAIMCMDKKTKTTSVLTNDPLKHMNLFLADGSRVEYFSATHTDWYLATVRAEVSSDNYWGVSYTAVLANDQERTNSMHVMRKPFETDDFVEVLLNRATVLNLGNKKSGEDDELEEWFAGRISSPPQKYATRSGYPVRLDRSGEHFGNVSSWRIRQRYPRGQHVYVYRGVVEGWSLGVVADSASKDGLGAKPCKVSAFEHGQDAVQPLKIRDIRERRERQEREKRERRIRNVQQIMKDGTSDSRTSILEREVDPWVLVPVVLDRTGHHEEVPSYLVRRCVQTHP